MDRIDKDILVSLLRDGRYSKSKIAQEIGTSPQFINYRIKKMMKNEIIKDFKIHLNPYYFNAYSVFLAFEGSANLETRGITSIFKCLERLYFFELQGKDFKDLEFRIDELIKLNGMLKMKYVPHYPINNLLIRPIDLNIIKILKDQPISTAYDISKNIDLPSAKVKKRLEILKKNAVFSVVPIIDLSRVDLFIYAIIAKKPSALSPLRGSWILRIMDDNAGIFVSIANSISEVRSNLEIVKKIDSESEVMIIYDYDFMPDEKLLKI